MDFLDIQPNMEIQQEGLPLIDLDIRSNSIIKVMGVGGGGCNAVNYLYNQGVEDITYLVCNTDRQALEKSPIPAKLQLGKGLGAGGKPEAAALAAEESESKIREALSDGTQMLFITAGMGGGTGTGASPVVARIAQDMNILTVGIVTIPFLFEGQRIIKKALNGIARLAEHVDALLVINNEKLRLIYNDFDLPNAFSRSDEVVSNAAKSIAEIITVPGYINTDFQDVYNTLEKGGVAIMNVGTSNAKEGRITKAIQEALNSPLVNNTNVKGAKRILINFYCSKEKAIRMNELEQITEFINQVGDEVEVKWGASYDESLDETVRVTLIATGYPVNDIPGIETEEENAEENAVVAEEIAPEKPKVDEVMKNIYGPLGSKENDLEQETPLQGTSQQGTSLQESEENRLDKENAENADKDVATVSGDALDGNFTHDGMIEEDRIFGEDELGEEEIFFNEKIDADFGTTSNNVINFGRDELDDIASNSSQSTEKKSPLPWRYRH